MTDHDGAVAKALERRARAVAEEFARKFGVSPEGVWAAPGRANLIGEHTDYNEGYALPFAIGRHAMVAVRRRSDRRLRLVSAQKGETELDLEGLRPGGAEGWAAYVAGAAWAVDEAAGGTSGIDLLLDSDVPLGAGLSSSAAVECAVVKACAELAAFSASNRELALLAQRAETEMAGVPCGLMDQLASTHGRPGHALLVDFRSLALEALPLPLAQAELALLAIDTRAPHRLVGGEYAARRAACRQAARALGVDALRDARIDQLQGLDESVRAAARHVVTENERVLRAAELLRSAEAGRRGGPLETLGPLLSASHASLRDDFRVTVDELDVAAEAAEQSGALGARMMGGGFGGSIIALVRATAVAEVSSAVERAFSERGFAPPHAFEVAPVAGARRVC